MNRTAMPLRAALLLIPGPLLAQSDARAGGGDWWRDGVCYEVFVRSFQDSDGDGVGDFPGLTSKLDYINDGDPATADDLGATCIWLMPIMPSPSYHGYDVTNYYDIHRDYGTLADFRRFLDAAHARGIHVLVDLVLNHISSEHPIFRDALLRADSPYRDWFIWSPTTRPAPGWSAPVWHDVPGRDEYYYGLFWSGMPDYDLGNPEVTAELVDVARFWLEDVGVDGFRIDAVGHLFEGPNGEWKDGPGTHPWLREYAAALRRIDPDVFTIGEVYDDIDALLAYFPDQLKTHFMFELADATLDAVRTGSKQRLVATMERVEREFPDHRWGVFLRNHDQTRTLTDLGGDVARARLAATIQLTLPGLPFVYYGEEIGMTGDKRDGDPRLRTPMQWAAEPGVGFTTGRPWEPLPEDSFAATVAAQEASPRSLLAHYRALIHLRTSNAALARGDFVPLEAAAGEAPADAALAYLRVHEGRAVLVLANLGEAPLADVRVSSEGAVLPPGRYTVRPLLGDGRSATVTVGGDGRIRGLRPVPRLGPRDFVVLEIE
jgi:alpha-amylase